MAIQFELYKTPRPKDEADKETYHARVVNFQHIDTDYHRNLVAKGAVIKFTLKFIEGHRKELANKYKKFESFN